MRFVILNTDYPAFLHSLYSRYSELESAPYDHQMLVRIDSLFGMADFYSSNLRKLGHEAYDIFVNNKPMQMAWVREHHIQWKDQTRKEQWWARSLQLLRHIAGQTPLRHLKPVFGPMLRSLDHQESELVTILEPQIKHYRPDVLLNLAMDDISPTIFRRLKAHVRLLVGQHAAPLPTNEDYSVYDLIISSLPNFVRYFREIGIPAEFHRLGFELRVLDKLRLMDRDIPASFVGSLSAHHSDRMHLLEYLSAHLDLQVWGPGVDNLPAQSWIHRRYQGPAWGIEMYQILRNSKITLNHHIGEAECYANNMRLFEGTGVGTLLITDWKVNLHEMFEPGKEVVAYHTPEECADLVRFYLKNDSERKKIALAGQRRCLQEHTYYQRMQKLVALISGYF